MPDESGKLNSDEKQRIIKALESKFSSTPPCPFCGNKYWDLAPYAAIGISKTKDNIIPVGQNMIVQKQIQLISPCGYIATFAAETLGIGDL